MTIARRIWRKARDIGGSRYRGLFCTAIRGTRVPVYDVATSIATRHPVERILDAWPSLDAEKVRLAAIYTEANPLHGRPRASTDLPEGSAIITDRRAPQVGKAG